MGSFVYIPGAWTLKQLLTNPKSFFDNSPKNPDGTRIIIDEEELLKLYQKEPTDIWVNTFGGARSNFIVNLLEEKYFIRNEAHRAKGCHYIRPLDIGVQKGVFCFVDDLGLALSSQLNRDFSFNYFKLRDDESEFSIEGWIDRVSQQIENWTKSSYFPIVLINTDRVAENSELFEETFGVSFSGFEVRNTSSMHPLLEPYQDKIAEVNALLSELPDFAII